MSDIIEIIVDQPPQILEIVAAGPQGPQGPQGIQGIQGPQGIQGIPGPNEIGGFPVAVADAQEKDLLQLKSWTWQNTPQEALTDGGNF